MMRRGPPQKPTDPYALLSRNFAEKEALNNELAMRIDDDELVLDSLAETFHAKEGEGENVESASMEKPIDSSNKGYQLMMRMGWNGSSGLGRSGQGITEPVPIIVRGETNMGVGVREAEEERLKSEVFSRKLLESEREETDELKQRRLEDAALKEQRKADIKDMLSDFKCEVCDKQYKNVREYNEHLGSLAHGHVVRLAEARKRKSQATNSKKRKDDDIMEAMRRAGALGSETPVDPPAFDLPADLPPPSESNVPIPPPVGGNDMKLPIAPPPPPTQNSGGFVEIILPKSEKRTSPAPPPPPPPAPPSAPIPPPVPENTPIIPPLPKYSVSMGISSSKVAAKPSVSFSSDDQPNPSAPRPLPPSSGVELSFRPNTLHPPQLEPSKATPSNISPPVIPPNPPSQQVTKSEPRRGRSLSRSSSSGSSSRHSSRPSSSSRSRSKSKSRSRSPIRNRSPVRRRSRSPIRRRSRSPPRRSRSPPRRRSRTPPRRRSRSPIRRRSRSPPRRRSRSPPRRRSRSPLRRQQ